MSQLNETPDIQSFRIFLTRSLENETPKVRETVLEVVNETKQKLNSETFSRETVASIISIIKVLLKDK